MSVFTIQEDGTTFDPLSYDILIIPKNCDKPQMLQILPLPIAGLHCEIKNWSPRTTLIFYNQHPDTWATVSETLSTTLIPDLLRIVYAFLGRTEILGTVRPEFRGYLFGVSDNEWFVAEKERLHVS